MAREIVVTGCERDSFTTPRPKTLTATLANTLNSDVNAECELSGMVMTGEGLLWPCRVGQQSSRPPSHASVHAESAPPEKPVPPAVLAGITLDKLERIRQVMPAEQFRSGPGRYL